MNLSAGSIAANRIALRGSEWRSDVTRREGLFSRVRRVCMTCDMRASVAMAPNSVQNLQEKLTRMPAMRGIETHAGDGRGSEASQWRSGLEQDAQAVQCSAVRYIVGNVSSSNSATICSTT